MNSDETCVFLFERGAFFGGTLNYQIYDCEIYMRLVGEGYNNFADMPKVGFTFPRKEMRPFTELIRKIEHWNDEYRNDGILDGYGWTYEYHFDGIDIRKDGYAAHPEDFSPVTREMQMLIEDLCRKYAPDYDENRISERLEL